MIAFHSPSAWRSALHRNVRPYRFPRLRIHVFISSKLPNFLISFILPLLSVTLPGGGKCSVVYDTFSVKKIGVGFSILSSLMIASISDCLNSDTPFIFLENVDLSIPIAFASCPAVNPFRFISISKSTLFMSVLLSCVVYDTRILSPFPGLVNSFLCRFGNFFSVPQFWVAFSTHLWYSIVRKGVNCNEFSGENQSSAY